jgi:hypothetical protein
MRLREGSNRQAIALSRAGPRYELGNERHWRDNVVRHVEQRGQLEQSHVMCLSCAFFSASYLDHTLGRPQ